MGPGAKGGPGDFCDCLNARVEQGFVNETHGWKTTGRTMRSKASRLLSTILFPPPSKCGKSWNGTKFIFFTPHFSLCSGGKVLYFTIVTIEKSYSSKQNLMYLLQLVEARASRRHFSLCRKDHLLGESSSNELKIKSHLPPLRRPPTSSPDFLLARKALADARQRHLQQLSENSPERAPPDVMLTQVLHVRRLLDQPIHLVVDQ